MNAQGLCKECRFWVSPDSMRGYCFLEPPKVMLMPVAIDSQTGGVAKPSRLNVPNAITEQLLPTAHRPLTLASDFCGKYEGRVKV